MKKYEDDDDDDDDEEDDTEFGSAQPSRARELLANFYGKLGNNGEDDDQDGLDAESAAEPIDRSEFDADLHVRQLLQKRTLRELLEDDDALCREVKSRGFAVFESIVLELRCCDANFRRLSGDMQMLVYENYSKFISATDTIRDMQRNVEAMEGEMSA